MSDWILLSEAEGILTERGQDPRPCISELITKSHWKAVQPFRPWDGSNGRWLGRPEFDIQTSRMVVEIHTLRRGPAGADKARQWRDILVSRSALDAGWPEQPPQSNVEAAKASIVRKAERYFLEIMVRGDRINDVAAFDLLLEQFPGLSRKQFLENIWPQRPPEWHRKGPIPGKKRI
ncbi:hypothetical protein V7794_24480 [Rhizobium laguerreae]